MKKTIINQANNIPDVQLNCCWFEDITDALVKKTHFELISFDGIVWFNDDFYGWHGFIRLHFSGN
jgi:hypothetical protein